MAQYAKLAKAITLRRVVKGIGGVPGGQIMENEFDSLAGRGGPDGHFAAKFVKKYRS